MALNPRQALFVREYLVDRNGTQAALRAGYSAKSAKQEGTRLLSNPEIKRQIQEREDVIAEKLDLSAERIERELARIAFGDATQLFKPGGLPLEPLEIPPHLRPLFAGYEVDPASETKGERRTLKICSTTERLRAIELLSRRHPAFRTTTDVNFGAITQMTPMQKAERAAALIEKGRAKK